METNNKKDIFLEGTAEESEKVLQTEEKTNEYIAFLKPLLATIGDEETRQRIADYGMHKLYDDENENLAIYFFILSNLKDFSKTERDFFTDTMLYCEAPDYSSLSQIKERYEKIRPSM